MYNIRMEHKFIQREFAKERNKPSINLKNIQTSILGSASVVQNNGLVGDSKKEKGEGEGKIS